VATSTQNQALSVLEQELPWLDGIVRWRTIMTSGRSRNSWATRDVSTTQIYTHVLNRGPAGVRSPADRMPML
jgi:hypothetical protein